MNDDDMLLIDTNIVIGILNNTIDAQAVTTRGPVSISSITIMELYALAGMDYGEEHRIDVMLRAIPHIPITASIAKRAGILVRTRSKNQKADLLIAATALEFGLRVLTRNVRDFKGVDGLMMESL